MTADDADIDRLRAAREHVLGRIADACARVGREPAEVSLVAVTKTVAVERVRAAVAAGLTVLGENRVQEGEAKAASVYGATWHLIGPLQSNKARRAIETFDMIESLDSVALAVRLDRLAGEDIATRRLPVLLQVNVDRDPAKAGFRPEALSDAIAELERFQHLEIRGLMTVGRFVDRPEDARPTFVALRVLSDELRSRRPHLGPELSMGMTD